jgi:hypothetical protein
MIHQLDTTLLLMAAGAVWATAFVLMTTWR